MIKIKLADAQAISRDVSETIQTLESLFSQAGYSHSRGKRMGHFDLFWNKEGSSFSLHGLTIPGSEYGPIRSFCGKGEAPIIEVERDKLTDEFCQAQAAKSVLTIVRDMNVI